MGVQHRAPKILYFCSDNFMSGKAKLKELLQYIWMDEETYMPAFFKTNKLMPEHFWTKKLISVLFQ